MGCVASKKIDNEERVQRCRERKRLIKQLVILRGEFASAQIAYLKSLKNTGATLRQFAEAESKELDVSSSFDVVVPSSPSSPLPPPSPPPPPLLPPPPPPPFSPDRREDRREVSDESFIRVYANKERLVQVMQEHRRGAELEMTDEEEEEENSSDDDDEEQVGQVSDERSKGKSVISKYSLPPPPPPPGSSWESWDPFAPISSSSSSSSGSPVRRKKNGSVIQKVEDEDWEEAKTEFEEEEEGKGEVSEQKDEEVEDDFVLNSLPEKNLVVELTDDNSSVTSGNTRDTVDEALVSRRRRSFTLLGIVREIDDYFLKAYDSGREVAVLLEIKRGDSLHHDLEESQRKSFKSAKVFSALSWSWSSKSLQSSRDAVESDDSNEPCGPGAHCTTLEKLSAEEERLYKEIKEEEITKLEYERKTLLLQKQEVGDHDLLRTEEIRSSIESLESNLSYLQHSIGKTCVSILKLRDEELHPQLLELSLRLTRMWRTMYECHQVQNNIAEQVNRISNYPSTEPTTDYHQKYTIQLETEVNAWHNNFCNLIKSQRAYVCVLSRWVQLAEYLGEDQPQINCTSTLRILCEEWQISLDKLPEKVAAEAIKTFMSVIHSIVLQQTEERILQKKSDRLNRRLEKELNTLTEMEKKFDCNSTAEMGSSLSPNHPLVVKRARIEAFKRKVDEEKAKYLHSVTVSRAMTLNNLQTSLPNVFQALAGFSNVCLHTLEAIHGHTQSEIPDDVDLVT